MNNPRPKAIFVIIDGAADEGPNTPLMTAKMPNLDLLARNSLCGMWEGPIAPKGYNLRSLSEMGTLQLLGYEANETPGRGFLEALGIGIKPDKKTLYFRTNFATLSKGRIVDRRAGRDERGLDQLAKLLDMKIDNVQIKFKRSHGHRGVLALKPLTGKISTDVSDSDVGLETPQQVVPLKGDIAAKRTADILNEFIVESHKRLSSSSVNNLRKIPANYILIRGAGQYRKIEPFSRRWNLKTCCIAASGIVNGVARYVGIKTIEVDGANAQPNTNLKGKLSAAINALNAYDFVVMHIKGTDTASHNKDPKLKRTFLERIDREVVSELLHMRNIDIIIATDHVTSSKTGEHVFGPVPFMLYMPHGATSPVAHFDERNCSGHLVFHNPMERMLIEFRHRH